MNCCIMICNVIKITIPVKNEGREYSEPGKS